MKTQFYSATPVQCCSDHSQTKQSLKKAVQSAISKEDRSRNFVVFALIETDDGKLSDKVDELFEQIKEKPRYEAVRI